MTCLHLASTDRCFWWLNVSVRVLGLVLDFRVKIRVRIRFMGFELELELKLGLTSRAEILLNRCWRL